MTNGERIRLMNDEELWNWLDSNTCTGYIERCDDYETCRECWKDWAAAEADGADGSKSKED